MAATILDYDQVALIQKSIISQPGPYGNQQNSPSNQSFNTAVGIGAGLFNVAKSLIQQPPAPPNYVKPPLDQDYILTELERQAIDRKCQQLAANGVVPLDSLTNFFYILASTTSVNDLIYIGNVIGVPELGDERYVRNIRGVCDIHDIYKVGYLSQGVSSVVQRYGSYNKVQSVSNPYGSPNFANVQKSLDVTQQLGILGPIVISTAMSLTGNQGPLSQAPNPSQFAITNSINTVSGILTGQTQGLNPQTIQSILNPGAVAVSNLTTAGMGLLGNSPIGQAVGMLAGGSLGAASALQGLLSGSPLGGALGALGSLGGLGLGSLLGMTGGNAMGSFMSEMLTGNRLKTCQIANNPMLTPPSYAGKAFFGEAPVAIPALDQMFVRKVGSFGSPQNGNGVVSFGMQNFASFGSSMSVGSMVAMLTTGTPTIPPLGTAYGDMFGGQIADVANILNVKPTDMVEPRRSDNAIPFMIGMSSAIVGEKFSPFGSSAFSDSWKLAASAANEIQKVNPQYLNTARTSL